MSTLLDKIELRVPIDTGYLIGNTLRQFAMRGTNTWQVAAYRLASKEGTFGLSEGYNFSYLELLKGKLISNSVEAEEPERLCQFVRDGEVYRCEDMTIVNLEGIDAPKLEVCLVYANGSRTASQNYNVVKQLCFQNLNDFISVPSRHTPTIKFKFNIEPYDRNLETLVIESTPGVVKLAKESAVKSLMGLHI